ncbi:LptA/OstA family protein [Pedosphaera parvula]|uniref:Organic solvent tolerance-like N-terminal domain-containing protein n=1 Tax=Pedosphaera parvula (strain Ellin514) TaxID=320771 RepID=B9XMN5_PEDPL|nr:LptA/OstA family protein [Pedosphaera parvula]EEF58934.1 hypothetical protein Cflav_PD2936 [Pedosphaera parvula Ellin514]
MILNFLKKWVLLIPMALIGLALSMIMLAHGQPSAQRLVARDLKYPEHYDAPNKGQMRSLTTFKEAVPQSGGLLLGTGMKIESFRTNGEPETIIEAPDCTFNTITKSAYSPGPIQIRTADGKMHIDGIGFIWNTATNKGATLGLTISNKVHTILNKDLMKETNAVSTTARTNTAAATTNDFLHVYSDHMVFDRLINLITYTGNVRVEDVQLDLLCDVMTVQLKSGTNGGVDKIVADRNVVIINKSQGGRTTGDQAVYTTREGRQVVELTGNPHWQEGPREGIANLFVFERLPNNMGNLLHAIGDASLKMPSSAIGKSGLFLSQSTSETNAPAATNHFVEMYADSMTFLQPLKGPVQTITADKNVFIVDRERKSQATGGHAFYDSNTGLLELTENALWQAGQHLFKGSLLTFNQKENTFAARTNAYMKIPASALGRSTPFQTSTNSTLVTNQFIEILSKSYEAKDELLTFHDHVQAALVQGEAVLGTLECETLKVAYATNQVKGTTSSKTVYDLTSIMAEKNVYAHQLPFKNPQGRSMEKELKCDELTIQMRPATNLIQQILANQNVMSTQIDTGSNGLPVRTTLTSEVLTADFFPYTNQVETAVAERKVVITRDTKHKDLHQDVIVAYGTRGTYTGTNDLMTLTGSPLVVSPSGTLNSEPLILDRRHNKVLAPNYSLKFVVKSNAPGGQTSPTKTVAK